MRQFAAHGYYDISWQGDVLRIVVADLFNREGVEDLVADIGRAVLAHGPGAWGVMLDATKWQGGTPDAFALWLDSLEGWIREGGLAAYAALYAESIQLFLGGMVRDRLSPLLPYFSAPEEAACWKWLAEQGLLAGLSV